MSTPTQAGRVGPRSPCTCDRPHTTILTRSSTAGSQEYVGWFLGLVVMAIVVVVVVVVEVVTAVRRFRRRRGR